MLIKTRVLFTRFQPCCTLFCCFLWLFGSQAGAQAPAWQVEFGQPQEIWHAQTIVQLPSGDVVVAGDARTYRSLFLIRLSPAGDTLWTKHIPAGHPDERVFLHDFQTDAMGNLHLLYFDTGASTSFYSRMNAWGTEQMTSTLWPYAQRFALTDDGILFVGVNGPEQDAATCLLKIDFTGDIQWGKNLDLHANVDRLLPDNNGGFRMLGHTGDQGILSSLNAEGNSIWQQDLGSEVFSTDMALASDGSTVLVSSSDTGALYLQRVAADGSLLQSVYDFFTPAYMPIVHRVRLSDDGSLYLSGQLWVNPDNHTLLIVRYGPDFVRQGLQEIDGDESLWVGRDLVIGAGDQLMVCGYRQYLNQLAGVSSYFTVASVACPDALSIDPLSQSRVSLWPNPASDFIRIGGILAAPYRISVYQADGAPSFSLDMSGPEVLVDIRRLSPGVYWYSLHAAGSGEQWGGWFIIQRP